MKPEKRKIPAKIVNAIRKLIITEKYLYHI